MASNDERSKAGLRAQTVLVSLLAASLMAPTMVATVPTIDGWSETATLAPDDGTSVDGFGTSTAVDGDLAVVGAPNALDDGGASTGAAYVYDRTLYGQWGQETKLLAEDGDDRDGFGSEVDLDGDTVLVGAPYAEDANGDSTGVAYVFTRAGPGIWNQEAKLVADDVESGDSFGGAVSLDGDRALVGASLADTADGSAAGAAYVFARDATGTWTQEATLVAPDGESSDQFGEGVSLDGDTALVGAASDHDPGAEDTGSAYVLQESDGAWAVEAKLENPEPNDEDQFGAELSLDGDLALVASPYDDSQGTDLGSVYAFTRADDGTWSQEDTLRAADDGFLDTFGGSVSLDGDLALIGAPRDTNDNGFYAGAAYLFARDDTGAWSEELKLNASSGDADDGFGGSVSLDGGTAIVGASGAFDGAGASYVYEHLLKQVRGQVQETTGSGGPTAG